MVKFIIFDEDAAEKNLSYFLLKSVVRKEDRLLFSAVITHDCSLLRKALDENANVNAIDDEGKTPLHVLSENGNINLALIILKQKDIKLNERDIYGSTPLYLATLYKHYKMVLTLLYYGAKPNKVCRLGETPLHAAVSQRNFPIIKLLLESGAKVNHENRFGDSPIAIALELRNTKLIKLLTSYGARLNTQSKSYAVLSQLVLSANSLKHLKLLQLLLNIGADINSQNKINQWTILHLSAMRGEDILTKMVIRHGADLYIADTSNEIPLNVAVRFRNWSVAKIIFKAMEEDEELESQEK